MSLIELPLWLRTVSNYCCLQVNIQISMGFSNDKKHLYCLIVNGLLLRFLSSSFHILLFLRIEKPKKRSKSAHQSWFIQWLRWPLNFEPFIMHIAARQFAANYSQKTFMWQMFSNLTRCRKAKCNKATQACLSIDPCFYWFLFK